MEGVRIEWNGEGMRELFRSEAVKDVCYTKAVEHLPVSDAWINSHAHSPMKKPCTAFSKRLDNTCIGIVRATTKGSAAIARKYGMR